MGRSLGAAAVIAVGAVAFWYTRLVAPAWRQPFSASFGNVDLFTQIYPMSLRAAAWMHDGTFPLWDPYQFAGHPFLATALYGLCYPPNLVYLLLPTAVAIEALIVLHLVLAGWFTYRFAETIGLPPLARFAGAAVFVCGGFMVNVANWFTPALAASVWLPLQLVAVERIVRRGALRDAAVLAVAVALCFLAGWPQLFFYSTQAIAVYAGVGLVGVARSDAAGPPLARVVGLLAVGVALGLALTAVQLLPTRELQELGPRRPGGLSMDQLVPLGSMPPGRLATELLDWQSTRPFVTPYYLGPIVVALVVLSLCSTRGAPVIAMWIVLIMSGLVSLGLSTPFFEHVYLHLPGARLFRLPQRIVFLGAFAAAVLAACGVDALLTEGRGRWPLRLAAGLGTLIACGLWLARGPHPIVVELAIIAAAALVIAAAVLVRSPRVRDAVVAILVALVVGTLWWGGLSPYRRPYHGTQPLHAQDAIFDYVRAHQGLDRTYLYEVAFDYAVTPKQGVLQEIHSITDYEPLSLVRFAELYALIDKPRPVNFPFAGALGAAPDGPHLDLLELLSLRYVVVDAGNRALIERLGRAVPPWQRVPIAPTSRYRLLEHAAPLPRAYVATHATIVADRAASLLALQANDFDPRQTVVVETDPARPIAAGGVSPSPTPIVAARVVSYETRDVTIEADAPAAGFLVLTDTFFPGWVATVDGAPAPIYAANHVVRAVPIPAGHHVVVFRYEPASVRLGAWISALSGLALVALAVVGRAGPLEV